MSQRDRLATPPPPPLVSPQSSSSVCFRLPRRVASKSKIGSVDDIAVNLNRVLALSWLDSEFVVEALRRERQEFAEELQRRKIRTLMSMRVLGKALMHNKAWVAFPRGFNIQRLVLLFKSINRLQK
ncbi:uncharacterized protein LOC121050644 [Rosa chinensis]|uniref:uncharacterized protein LOC121050644 n=1 Tax=Rosa chinensis TaxID=74649 RepID=UPI001AD9479F|nr:uncharacterized protein LOC121050644 [Rosa chinensis]